jgi:hypothetical protein
MPESNYQFQPRTLVGHAGIRSLVRLCHLLQGWCRIDLMTSNGQAAWLSLLSIATTKSCPNELLASTVARCSPAVALAIFKMPHRN